MIHLLAVLTTQAPTVTLDEGTLVVHVDTLEVARETFRLVARRAGDSTTGWVLVATTRWAGRPAVVLSPVLQLDLDSEPSALAYDIAANGTSQHISGQPGPGRFTLRYLAAGLERARELAAGPRTVIVDDSVFAPLLFVAWRAGGGTTSVTAIFPRAPRREPLTVTDLGLARTTLNRDPATLRHILVAGGTGGPVHVWLTPDGRLMKVEIPQRSVRAERLPS